MLDFAGYWSIVIGYWTCLLGESGCAYGSASVSLSVWCGPMLCCCLCLEEVSVHGVWECSSSTQSSLGAEARSGAAWPSCRHFPSFSVS